MRVLVTGATGYIGSAVLASLKAAGLSAVTVGRSAVDGVPFVQSDLLAEVDFAGLVRRTEATHLVHLAWETAHGAYWTHPANPRWAVASARLVEAFCDVGCEGIVVAGSSAEYDWSHGWCREDGTPSVPATPYGAAKDAARRVAQSIAGTAGVPLAWARPFLSYGPAEDPRRLVPAVAAVLRGEVPAFEADLGAYRDFLHVSDVGSALVELLRARADGIANVCSGEPVRIGEVVTLLAAALDADPQPMLALARERPGEPRLLAGDPSRLKALGWAPALPLADGLALCTGKAA